MSIKTYMRSEGVLVFSCEKTAGFENPVYYNEDYSHRFVLAEFFGVELFNSNKIRTRRILDFDVKYNDETLESFRAFSNSDLYFNDINNDYFCALLYVNRGMDTSKIGIISLWLDGCSNISWRDFDDPNLKNSWMTACQEWNLKYKSKIPPPVSKDIILQCDEIFCREDFYCLLGETALGYRGYFGRDLCEFDEYLKECVYKYGTTLNIKITNFRLVKTKKLTFINDEFIRLFRYTIEKSKCTLSIIQ